MRESLAQSEKMIHSQIETPNYSQHNSETLEIYIQQITSNFTEYRIINNMDYSETFNLCLWITQVPKDSDI